MGYQSKKGKEGILKIFVSTLWKYVDNSFDGFVYGLIYTTLLERICLERCFQKIRMINRCKPFRGLSCKMEYILKNILEGI